MYEKIVEIPTADGRMETFIPHPEQGGPFAPVVVYMDVWGLREELYDIARKVAVVGFYVVLPDLYYRQGRIRHQWRNGRGQMISMHNLDPERQAQVRAPLQKLSDAMVVADSGAILDFLTGEPVRQGGVGSIGYCMGGRHVMCVAGAYPERFVAGASLHGTQLVSDRDDSPHRLADRFRGQLYCGFAEKDPNATPPIRQALSEAFAGCQVDYCYEVHPGAEHGYALPDRDIHDKRAANRDLGTDLCNVPPAALGLNCLAHWPVATVDKSGRHKTWEVVMKSAYGRQTPPPDYELTCVEPGSPMGELLRRYWQPVCTSDELSDCRKR